MFIQQRLEKVKERKRGIFLLIFFLLVVVTSCLEVRDVLAIDVTAKRQHQWLEIGGDMGYQETNGWYESQKDFYISILAFRGGYRFYLKDFLFIDPYLKLEFLRDLGNKENNKFFWNNSFKYGYGARLRLEYKRRVDYAKEFSLRLTYANLDYYMEYLGINFMNRGNEVPPTVPKKDFKSGFNSWISILNNKRTGKLMGGIWFEMWSDLTYHKTNFFQKGKEHFLILTLCPKIGLRVAYKGIALETYFRIDIVRDVLNEDWNREAWSNNIKYGPGIRLSLGGLTKRPDNPTVYLYGEFLSIDYLERTTWKSIGLSKDDFRAGINLWLPLGASKGIY